MAARQCQELEGRKTDPDTTRRANVGLLRGGGPYLVSAASVWYHGCVLFSFPSPSERTLLHTGLGSETPS